MILNTGKKSVRLKIEKLRLIVLNVKEISKFTGIEFRNHRIFFAQYIVELFIVGARFQRKGMVKK
ncbi:MAG: hypothetical protein KKF46_04860 [Nanoarchaeota archaeon]|nr:hypothetical protein [Nanoarchaeota archaeon]MBU1321663.1 hypothetical protein [Nanoarchaeota archaeon]MBU1596879.1 hypothetical protein [Nanoarchaeota archaeon]MBU2442332.1 hypothetical protein [Nanoarchaeota archaeon]